MQFVDLNAWMVGDILLKADKMSMANSLEVRVPFLDKKIMELAERIPLKYRVNDENTKFAMRKAALRRMPEKWAGKKKLGFPVPTRVWLKEDKYYNIVKEKFTGEVANARSLYASSNNNTCLLLLFSSFMLFLRLSNISHPEITYGIC